MLPCVVYYIFNGKQIYLLKFAAVIVIPLFKEAARSVEEGDHIDSIGCISAIQ